MNKVEIEKLHGQLLAYWNMQGADGMSSLFYENGNVIGFDGSQMDGKAAIKTELEKVFKHHQTARYVWKVEEVRFLNERLVLLRAIVGMIPPGKNEINPATNAIQTLVAGLDGNLWRVWLFQNTPAQFHGRPELVEKMTNSLNELISR